MFSIKTDKKANAFFVVIRDGDCFQEVLRAIVKASYALHFPYYGLGFLDRNPAAELSDEEADRYISMDDAYMVINMPTCRSKECHTYVYKTGTPLILYVDKTSFEKARGPVMYLFSEMRAILARNQADE